MTLGLSAETFAYAAPELVLHDVCTFSSDIYSFGVIMWEVLTHELPIRGSLRAISVPFEAPEAVGPYVEPHAASVNGWSLL